MRFAESAVFYIAKHTVSRMFERKVMLLLYILLPLTVLLALQSGIAGSVNNLSAMDITVEYSIDTQDKYLKIAVDTFIDEMSRQGCEFRKIKSLADAEKNLGLKETDAVLVFTDDSALLYQNEYFDSRANLIKTSVSTFLEQYHIIVSIFGASESAGMDIMLGRYLPDRDEAVSVGSGMWTSVAPLGWHRVTFGENLALSVSLFGCFLGMLILWPLAAADLRSTLTKRLKSMNISPHVYTSGIIIGVIFMSLMQTAAVALAAVLFLGADMAFLTLPLIITAVAGSIVACSLCLIISARFERNISLYITLAAVFILSFFGGCLTDSSQYEGASKIISYFMPSTWILDTATGVGTASFSALYVVFAALSILICVILPALASLTLKKKVIL